MALSPEKLKKLFLSFHYMVGMVCMGIILAAVGMSCSEKGKEKNTGNLNLTRFVDPYIGTGDHGHVFMGANVPFGLVQLGPTNLSQGWDWTSGYHISDQSVIGFGHMHLSGTGIGDLGDIALMPVTGDVPLKRSSGDDPESGIYSTFDRKTETAHAGYYAVHLDRFGIDVELTATKRTGFHKYIFPAGKEAKVIIDLVQGIGWDAPVEGCLVQESNTVISGYRYSKGWANDQKVYFVAEFSQPMGKFEVADHNGIREGHSLKGARVYGQAAFGTGEPREIMVKVALSPVSVENAKLNMKAELPHWDFEKTKEQATLAWEEELEKIVIETSDEKVKRVFYTALYHTMTAPSEFCDVNGEYRGSHGKMMPDPGFRNYTTFSLWDTYRAAHPLMTLIHPEKMPDMVNTMLTVYREQGKLPVWHLMGCETDCMVGNPGICVVADAVMKGFEGFDYELAFETMKNSAMRDERGIKWLKELGYIPFDKEPEGLSKCMEYAIADWSIAQAAHKLGKEADYEYFLHRSKSYRHYFDSETGFVRGKSSEGKFREKFNPFESVHRDNDYTEGNAWQYTWLVPHDIEGLVGLFGSKKAFTDKLDALFTTEGSLGEHASPDISGMIGQYAHGNEPSHHVIYLYPYVGQPWKTAEKAREIMTRLYSDQPAGLCGNEDVGQMSAWYILSAMGLYQVEPAGGNFIFGSPLVDTATIRLGNGKTFTIKTTNNSNNNIYIQSMRLNGRDYPYYNLFFRDITAGGELEITMGPSPSPVWGLREKKNQ